VCGGAAPGGLSAMQDMFSGDRTDITQGGHHKVGDEQQS
jgi:hypothetical protein